MESTWTIYNKTGAVRMSVLPEPNTTFVLTNNSTETLYLESSESSEPMVGLLPGQTWSSGRGIVSWQKEVVLRYSPGPSSGTRLQHVKTWLRNIISPKTSKSPSCVAKATLPYSNPEHERHRPCGPAGTTLKRGPWDIPLQSLLVCGIGYMLLLPFVVRPCSTLSL